MARSPVPDILMAMPPDLFWDVMSLATQATAIVTALALIARYSFRHLLHRNLEKLKQSLVEDRHREIETLKNDLARARNREQEELKHRLVSNIEELKLALAIERSEKELILQAKISFMERQLGELYWPIYSRLQKDNAIWEFFENYRQLPDHDRDLLYTIETETLLPNHLQVVHILESRLHLAQADAEFLNLSQRYIRHVALFQALRTKGWREDPQHLGEPWPSDFFHKVETVTKARQHTYEALLQEQTRLSSGQDRPRPE